MVSQKVNISLPPGETCAYMINADCGVPGFVPQTTVGYDIQTVDYTDADIGVSWTVPKMRLLQGYSADDFSDSQEE
jgi:hypothetical protein